MSCHPKSETKYAQTASSVVRSTLMHYLTHPLCKTDIGSDTCSRDLGMPLRNKIQALMAVGIISILLRYDLQTPKWSSRLAAASWNTPAQSMIVPTACDISCGKLMDLPLPFSPNAAKDFTDCHLSKMTSRQFLEDGEWTGFCSNVIGYETFDPPMHGIRFVGSQILNSSDLLSLHASGVDSVGQFDLDGMIAQKSGRIWLEMRYKGRHGWFWCCVMTPFGIVGTWGEGSFTHGWIWLWKTAWPRLIRGL